MRSNTLTRVSNNPGAVQVCRSTVGDSTELCSTTTGNWGRRLQKVLISSTSMGIGRALTRFTRRSSWFNRGRSLEGRSREWSRHRPWSLLDIAVGMT